MFAALFLAMITPGNDPTPKQIQLLKIFHSEFIRITPGKEPYPKSFRMGGAHPSEQPVREVRFNYEFQIAKYEVPQNLWEVVMGSNPSRWKGDRNSVEMLSFDQARTFCQKTTKLMQAANLIDKNEIIRLPSEAEWEYVARAGTPTAYSFGNDMKQLDQYAWHTGNAAGNDPPVGAKKPNPWGLYDIHGYLWEWCLDVAHNNYQGAPTDGSAWAEGGDQQRRSIRGGSWKDQPEYLSSSCRRGTMRRVPTEEDQREVIEFTGGINKQLEDDALGLRCVLSTRPAGTTGRD